MKTRNRLSNEAISMRDFLRSTARRLSVSWFWPLVVLVLPNCGFSPGSIPPSFTAVFCDIEKPLVGRHCASDDEKSRGIRLAEAAVALNRGDAIDLALDDSPAARGRCGGEPEAVLFQGAFPQGQPTCVSASSASTACTVPCEQYFGQVQADGSLTPDNPPDPLTVAFCQQHARLSANVPQNPLGYSDGCTTGGKLVDYFVDPRAASEAIEWDPAGQIGVAPIVTSDGFVTHSSISRSAFTSPPANNPPFDAGAASSQWFSHGDGFVEFSALENNLSHILGLSEVSVPPLGCLFNACDDTDPSFVDIRYGISLNKDGFFYLIENGQFVQNGPGFNGSWGQYLAGDRFRVNVKDNSDTNQTATISYSRIVGSCSISGPCPEVVFYTSQIGPGHYPLRVDTSFREQGATLSDIRIVRIH